MIFLIDHNLKGHALVFFGAIALQGWLDIAPVQFVTFDQVNLSIDSDDRVVWRLAQANQMILLTANRSMKGKDSLEQVMREENTKVRLNMSETYLTDFSSWINQTAQLLRERRWHEIDVPNLIEEVEDLGKSERRGIASQLTRLLLHLLKWQYQPQRRSDSWLDSITDARTQIELTIEDSPSLSSYPAEQLAGSYQRARRQAAKQTGMEISTFPEVCPYSLEVVLAENWLPES